MPSSGSPKHEAIRNPAESEVIRINAARLFDIYEQNDVNGDQLYKGKILEVTGSVDDISRGFMGEIYITFNRGDFKVFTVQCFFSDDFADRAAKLRPGSFVRVRGHCTGKAGNVLVKDCILVE